MQTSQAALLQPEFFAEAKNSHLERGDGAPRAIMKNRQPPIGQAKVGMAGVKYLRNIPRRAIVIYTIFRYLLKRTNIF